MEKELLFEIKANTQSVNIKELNEKGSILDITLAGKVSGKTTGIIMTTHNMVMKADGSVEDDLRSMIFTNDGPIRVTGKAMGKLVPHGPDPTIEKIEENLTFNTPSPKLAYLNTTKVWAEATYNIATGEYSGKVYTLK